jgi:signal transduction histidine kinase
MCATRPRRQDCGVLARLRFTVAIGTLFWLLVVVGVGAIDLSTGPDYGFGFFYLIAVVPAAWLLGRWPGIAIGLASGFAWFFADVVEHRIGSLGPIVWNASSRLLLFVLAAWLIDLVHRERERLRTLDRERSHFMRVLEHELAGPGEELSRGLRALQQSGGATASELQPLVERAQDLEFLSRDFVSLGQLQSGELWLQHRQVDLRAVVEELRTRPSDKGPRIPITLSSASFIVAGDDARLRQAIGSLLNEARAAKTSDVSIDLRRDGGNARLTITGGVGPFLALPPDDRGGIGIELARVIIQGHRGTLEHRRSAASKAVRFVVELPLR